MRSVRLILPALLLLAPAMAQEITTPEKFFGFPLGADKKMARWDKIVGAGEVFRLPTRRRQENGPLGQDRRILRRSRKAEWRPDEGHQHGAYVDGQPVPDGNHHLARQLRQTRSTARSQPATQRPARSHGGAGPQPDGRGESSRGAVHE